MDFSKIYRELIRRNVFRAVLAYLAVAWVLIEAASIILPTFDAPTYLFKGFIYLMAIGLVVWTAFAWVYDLTPQGLQRTSGNTDTREIQTLNNRRLNSVIVGAGITALLLLLAGSFWAGSQWKGEPIAPKDYRIAVLPFEDRSDNAEFQYLQEGLAEDVISKLFPFSGISVISSRSTFKFRNSGRPIEQIARELKADIIMVGNYAITNDKVDVKVEIINAEDNEILNYASFAADLGQIKEISAKIGDNLRQSLGFTGDGGSDTGDNAGATVHPEAFKLNALGQSAMRDHTGQELEDITRYFEAAIELDPEYADPYIGMAEAYIFEVNRGYLSSTEAAQKARHYVLEAEKLDPGSGKVSGLMGIIHFLEFDFKNAIPYFEKALQKTPNYSLTYHWYSFIMEYKGDFKKAEALQIKAGTLDPLNAFNDFYLILDYIFQEKFPQAEKLISAKLALDPDHKETLWVKAVLLVEMGRYREALEVLKKRKMGLETNFISGYVYAKTGQQDKARRVLERMQGSAYVPPSQLAILYCGLGQYEQALSEIEEAFLTHDGWFKWVVLSNMTDPVKEDPRYTSIINRLGI